MPIQGYTSNRGLNKIAPGSTDNWDVWLNENADALDAPSLLYQIAAAESMSAGQVAVIKDDGAGAKKAYLAASGTYTFGDPVGAVTETVTAGNPVRLTLKGRVQNNGWSFGSQDKFAYLSASGAVTTAQTATKLGYVLSSSSMFFDTSSASGGGGQTDTVTGSNGVVNTGGNVDAIISPVYGSAANTVCQGNDSRLHSQNTDSYTDSASFEINAFGNSARLLTTGLTANRDFTLPDATTKLVGEGAAASVTGDHDYSGGTLRLPTNAGVPSGVNDEGDVVFDTASDELYVGLGSSSWKKVGAAVSGFSVHKNGTAQSISGNTWTKLTWAAEDWDTNNDFDLANSRFTPASAGKYLLTGDLEFTGVGAGTTYQAAIYKNGSAYRYLHYAYIGIAGSPRINFAVIAAASAGDYFELYVFHSDSTARNVSGASVITWFSGARVE